MVEIAAFDHEGKIAIPMPGVGIEINTAIPGVEGATLISVDALETLRQRLPDGHPAVAKSMVDLGKLYHTQGGWLS
jgi:hypothetical protein